MDLWYLKPSNKVNPYNIDFPSLANKAVSTYI